MKTNRTKKEWMVLGIIFLVLFFFTTDVFSWGFATHGYINDHLGKKRGLSNVQIGSGLRESLSTSRGFFFNQYLP